LIRLFTGADHLPAIEMLFQENELFLQEPLGLGASISYYTPQLLAHNSAYRSKVLSKDRAENKLRATVGSSGTISSDYRGPRLSVV
jgi:hypothetical protein